MCPDGTYKESCQWERIFYVYVEDASERQIVVVTNSLPDHCYYVNSNPPAGVPYINNAAVQANTYQFTMRFNTPIAEMYKFRNLLSGPYVNSIIEDQTTLDIFQCSSNWATSSTLDRYIEYDEGTSKTFNPVNF